MKPMFLIVLLACAFSLFGCSKKEPSAPPPAPASEQTTPALPAVNVQAAAETVKQNAQAVTVKKVLAEVDLNKTVEAIRQEAATMDLVQLKEIALKYKQMLAEKQAAYKPLVEKIANLPLSERLGPESQSMAAEAKTLGDTVKALTERLAVYVEAIKARGGDTAGLTP